jgi:acyl-CoA synthetase (AMP-forming)/AMP-acid ligase II
MTELLHSLIHHAAEHDRARPALGAGAKKLSYEALEISVQQAAQGFCALVLGRGERVAVWLEKRIENIIAMFGASRAGAVFVPVNPVLKEQQVLHLLSDSTGTVRVTSRNRLDRLKTMLEQAPSVRHVVLIDSDDEHGPQSAPSTHAWNALLEAITSCHTDTSMPLSPPSLYLG